MSEYNCLLTHTVKGNVTPSLISETSYPFLYTAIIELMTINTTK